MFSATNSHQIKTYTMQNDQVFNQIIDALRVIYDPFVSHETRRAAEKFCEDIKADRMSPLYGYKLAHKDSGYPGQVRHFGLGLIEEAVRFRWNDGTYGPPEREKIRNDIIDLVSKGINDGMVEERYIKTKIAHIFVEVAKREWPGLWEDMDHLLQELYASGPTTQELVLIIHRVLTEDIFIRDDVVAEQRKKDLQTAMICSVASARVLKEQYPAGPKNEGYNGLLLVRGDPENVGWLARWTAAAEDYGAGWEQRHDAFTEKMAVLTLQTLAAQCEWILSKYALSCVGIDPISGTSLFLLAAASFIRFRAILEVKLVSVVCHLLLSNSPQIRTAASECACVLFSRNFPHLEDRSTVIWPVLDEGGLDIIFAAYSNVQLTPGQDVVDDTEFVKWLVQVRSCRNDSVPCCSFTDDMGIYLELMYIIGQNPSMSISAMTLDFWAAALKHEYVKSNAAIVESLPVSLEFCAQKLVHFQYNEADTSIDMDFDEIRTFAANSRIRVVDIIKMLVQMKPVESFIWMESRVKKELETLPSQLTSLDAVASIATPVEVVVDATFTLLESVIIGISITLKESDKSSLQELVVNMNRLLNYVLDIPSQNMFIIKHQLSVIAAYGDMLSVYPNSLLRVLDQAFTFVTRHSNANDMVEIHANIEIRSKASATLIKLGCSMPDVLLSIYDGIASSINNLITNGKVALKEKARLLEFLLTICHCSKAPLEWKIAIFNTIVVPVVAEWNSVKTAGILTSTATFMDEVGITALNSYVIQVKTQHAALDVNLMVDPQLFPAVDKCRRNRQNLLWAASTLLIFMKRLSARSIESGQPESSSAASNLWSSLLSQMLPNVLALIRCINGLWTEQAIAVLEEELRPIVGISDAEKSQILGIGSQV
ncbi:armadillo-type protein [Jimgerdemannia flammicorona]|uniref:Armadillo-type protein n=1 Tax=Jimgerdemannia flammicorona TaxID=994334 RepID=A0A433DLD9_9FUNG|nr:armadillo-type protein [Jimgerdemannia flammicorona]